MKTRPVTPSKLPVPLTGLLSSVNVPATVSSTPTSLNTMVPIRVTIVSTPLYDHVVSGTAGGVTMLASPTGCPPRPVAEKRVVPVTKPERNVPVVHSPTGLVQASLVIATRILPSSGKQI